MPPGKGEIRSRCLPNLPSQIPGLSGGSGRARSALGRLTFLPFPVSGSSPLLPQEPRLQSLLKRLKNSGQNFRPVPPPLSDPEVRVPSPLCGQTQESRTSFLPLPGPGVQTFTSLPSIQGSGPPVPLPSDLQSRIPDPSSRPRVQVPSPLQSQIQDSGFQFPSPTNPGVQTPQSLPSLGPESRSLALFSLGASCLDPGSFCFRPKHEEFQVPATPPSRFPSAPQALLTHAQGSSSQMLCRHQRRRSGRRGFPVKSVQNLVPGRQS